MRSSVRQYLLFLVGFLTTRVAFASLAESYLQTELVSPGARGDIHVTLVFSRSLEPRIPLLTEKTKLALELIPKRLGVPLRDDFWIFFDARPDDHNGLATVIPNNRIRIQTEAPFFTDSIGYGNDYLTETILHELGHMAPLQQRAGVFTILSPVFGTAARPVGLWPRWIHEGLAVWTEEALGGRPASGAIAFAERKYAEYVRRKGQAPLLNKDLDGRPQAREVEEGSLPYHFGYLLIDAWAKRKGGATPMESFIRASSKTLGSAFRSSFRAEGESIDTIFTDESKRWAATPLSSVAQTHDSTKTLVAEADSILGPFSNEAGLSWIETNSAGDEIVLAARRPDGKIDRTEWIGRYFTPQQVFPTFEGEWFALVRKFEANLALPARRAVMRYGRDGRLICTLDTPARLRELDIREGWVAWTRSETNGTIVAEIARIETPCRFSAPKEVARSRGPFERLSAPRILPVVGGEAQLAYSRSEGTNLTREAWEVAGRNLRAKDRALAAPLPIAPKFCPRGSAECLVGQGVSRAHWGPVLASRRGNRWTARTLPLATGSERSAWLESESRLALVERFWEKDRLNLVPLEAFDGPEFALTADAAPPPSTLVVSAPVRPETYSAWPSVLPHFWTPSSAIVPGGFLVMGQTFYEDVTKTWAGSTAIGYDSFVRRPFAATSLVRRQLEWGWLSQIGVSLNYIPVFNYRALAGDSPAQDRWGASMHVHYARLLKRDWVLTVTPELEYLGSAPAARVSGFHAFIPSVAAVLSSPYGVSPSIPRRRSDLTHAGIYLRGRLGTYKEPFSVQELNLSVPIAASAAQLTAQYASSGPANFPAIYYEWGGLPAIATNSTGFLSRGFAARAAAGPTVFRGGAEWQFTLAKPRIGFSWNRARLDTIESRWIAETVSFTSFSFLPGAAPFYQTGRQYFTSVGTVLDFWCSALHYVDFTAGVGLFRGFGTYGETRVSVVLRSWLDL